MKQKNTMESLEAGHWKRNFLVIASGQTISLIGSSAVQFALIWWLASETSSAMMLSLAGLFAFLPQLILGPFAGVWIDRLKRKTVIIGADIFIACAAGVFALLFLFGRPPYWSACMVLGARAVGNVFHTPAIQAAVPMLVPGEQLVRANGWSQFMQSGAFMLGPVLGAALYAAFPLPAIMLSDVIGAIIASISVAVIKIPDPPRKKQRLPNFFLEMKEGAGVFLRDKRLCIVTIASTLCMVFFLPLSALYPLMTSEHLAGTAWHASIIEFVYAGGMMLCAVLVSARGEIKNKFLIIHIALVGFGVTNLLCGLLPANLSVFWLFAILCALMGAGGNLFNIPYMAYLQQTIPPAAQGRAFSLIGSLMCLAMPLGLLVAGPVAEVHGVARWFFISGIAMIVIMLISGVLISQKEFSKQPRHTV
jgi:DHA3 family macrolide efflux protein-like MFS transporter